MITVGCSRMKWLSGDEKVARWAQSPLRGAVVAGSSPADDALDDLCRTLRVSLQQSLWESQMDGETQVVRWMEDVNDHGSCHGGMTELDE